MKCETGLAGNALVTLIARVGEAALALAAGVVAARLLLVDGKGELAAILLVGTTVYRALNLGFGQAIVRLVGREPSQCGLLAGTSVVLWVIWVGVFAAIMVALWWALRSSYLEDLNQTAFLLALLIPPLMLAVDLTKGLLRGLMRIPSANLVAVVVALVQIPSLLLLVGLIGLGVRGAVVAVVLSQVSGFGVGLVCLWSACRFRLGFRLANLRSLVGLSGQMFLYNTLLFFNFRLDQFFVKSFFGLRELGLYTAAVSVVEALWILPTSLGAVLYPTLAQPDADRGTALTGRVARFASLTVLVGGLGLAVISKQVFWLFGRDFSASIPSFLSLLPGIWAVGVATVIASDYLGRGDVLVLAKCGGAALALNLVAMLTLIPRFGAVGAGAASSLAYLLFLVLIARAYCHQFGISVVDLFLPQRGDLRAWWAAIRRLSGRGRRAA